MRNKIFVSFYMNYELDLGDNANGFHESVKGEEKTSAFRSKPNNYHPGDFPVRTT